MSVKKVLFLNQEIYPYLPESYGSKLTNKLHREIQEMGVDVRTFMPKFGAVNERRNQLHEVIRLSGLNIIIDDVDHPTIIKVATLQSARMQVYFLFNEDFFNKTLIKELETDTDFEHNDERSIFFVRGSLETIQKLMWIPEVVHCQGWISALGTVYLKYRYAEQPIFSNVKKVFSLLDDKFDYDLDPRLGEKLIQDGIPAEAIEKVGKLDYVGLCKLAIDASDGIIQAHENALPELVEYAKSTGKPFLPYQGEEFVKGYADFYNSL